MAICVDEENAFCLTKIGHLTPDTEPLSKIDSCILLQFFCNLPKEAFHFFMVVGGGVSNCGEFCSGAAE